MDNIKSIKLLMILKRRFLSSFYSQYPNYPSFASNTMHEFSLKCRRSFIVILNIKIDHYRLSGSVSMKVVPLPISDSTSIVPPLASTNIFDNANPNPTPVSLVVKSGSKIWEI
jgi:hypothetical protein